MISIGQTWRKRTRGRPIPAPDEKRHVCVVCVYVFRRNHHRKIGLSKITEKSMKRANNKCLGVKFALGFAIIVIVFLKHSLLYQPVTITSLRYNNWHQQPRANSLNRSEVATFSGACPVHLVVILRTRSSSKFLTELVLFRRV